MSASVSFTVPGVAPSKSNYRHDAKSRHKWSAILQYQQLVGLSAMAAGAKKHSGKGRVYVRILLVNQPIDPDGIFKAAMDGLKHVAYPDDASRWVRGCQVVAEEDPGPVRAEFRIEWSNEGSE